VACDYAEVLVSSVVVAETIVLLIAPRNGHAELAMVSGLNANAWNGYSCYALSHALLLYRALVTCWNSKMCFYFVISSAFDLVPSVL